MDQLAILMAEYPLIRDIAMVMIISRIVFKPLFSILAKYVELTVEMDDNTKLAKIMDSKAYKMVSFILDMSLSIKLTQRKK